MKLLTDQYLFWDVNIDTLDPNSHKQFIIERVLERGSWENIKEVVSFYGKDKLVTAAKQAKWLSEKTMYFVSGYFKIPLEEMRCFTQRQSSPIPYL